jgi:hypothetical protein
MNDDWICVEPRQEAVLSYDDVSVSCHNVPEAWLAWAQLDAGEKTRATITVGDDVYDAYAIKRLRYAPMADAA